MPTIQLQLGFISSIVLWDVPDWWSGCGEASTSLFLFLYLWNIGSSCIYAGAVWQCSCWLMAPQSWHSAPWFNRKPVRPIKWEYGAGIGSGRGEPWGSKARGEGRRVHKCRQASERNAVLERTCPVEHLLNLCGWTSLQQSDSHFAEVIRCLGAGSDEVSLLDSRSVPMIPELAMRLPESSTTLSH